MQMTRSVSLNLPNFRQESVAYEETVALKHFNLYRSYGTCGNFTPYVPKFRQFLTHIVKEHETLAGIALKYDLSTEDIKRTNSFLWTSNSVWVGQVIKVPVSDPDSTKIVSFQSITVNLKPNSCFSILDDEPRERETGKAAEIGRHQTDRSIALRILV